MRLRELSSILQNVAELFPAALWYAVRDLTGVLVNTNRREVDCIAAIRLMALRGCEFTLMQGKQSLRPASGRRFACPKSCRHEYDEPTVTRCLCSRTGA